jgi:hypothetical protein
VDYAAIYNMTKGNFDDNMLPNVKVWVNWAQHEILSVRGWSWRLATTNAVALVASQQAYQLTGTSPVAQDFGGLVDVQLELTASGSRKSLVAADMQVFDDLSAHSRVAGTPSVYTVTGGAPTTTSATTQSGGNQQLLVWPIPVATAGNGVNLFLRYWRNLDSVEMSADSDKPIIPVRHHAIIVEYAVAYGYSMLGLTQQAQGFLQLANQRLERMIMEDEQVYPPRDNKRLEYARPPTLQEQGHVTNPRLTLPVSQQPAA